MSDVDSPERSPGNDPVEDGKESEIQDETAAADSDRDSDLLSEIDENQFEDYDPETANIEDRPVDIEDIARTLKATKRKRADGDVPKKPREGRREKKRRDLDDEVPLEDEAPADIGKTTQRRSRRAGEGGERRRAKEANASPEPPNEEYLSPEERRKRAIDRALDAAIKTGSSTKRRRKDEIVCIISARHMGSNC